MTNHSYLVHRAVKFAKPSRAALALIDRDLARQGVSLPWSPMITVDLETRRLLHRTVRKVMDAA